VGGKVFPPTYPTRDGQSPYVREERVFDGQPRANVLLDSTPSQANRAEEALLRARRASVVEVPLLQIEHAGDVPVVLTSLEFPHRYADAYLRDSLLDGVSFDKTDLGRSLLASSLDDASTLYAHDPGSLVYGAWNSHRKGRQQKFPRVYASEVIGWDPVIGARNAGRMDPLNLQGAQKAVKSGEGWDYSPVATKVKGEKLSEIGHGNVAPNSQHGGVTITSAQRIATVSLAGLDRIGFGDASREAALAARAVLAAYAIVADRLAFGGSSLWRAAAASWCWSRTRRVGEPWRDHRGVRAAGRGGDRAVRGGEEHAASRIALSCQTIQLIRPRPGAGDRLSLTKAAAEAEPWRWS
jgi:CRISPR-associated protein Csb1